jgi:hypothetical protein
MRGAVGQARSGAGGWRRPKNVQRLHLALCCSSRLRFFNFHFYGRVASPSCRASTTHTCVAKGCLHSHTRTFSYTWLINLNAIYYKRKCHTRFQNPNQVQKRLCPRVWSFFTTIFSPQQRKWCDFLPRPRKYFVDNFGRQWNILASRASYIPIRPANIFLTLIHVH